MIKSVTVEGEKDDDDGYDDEEMTWPFAGLPLCTNIF